MIKIETGPLLTTRDKTQKMVYLNLTNQPTFGNYYYQRILYYDMSEYHHGGIRWSK